MPGFLYLFQEKNSLEPYLTIYLLSFSVFFGETEKYL